jgi:hypothetical protein
MAGNVNSIVQLLSQLGRFPTAPKLPPNFPGTTAQTPPFWPYSVMAPGAPAPQSSSVNQAPSSPVASQESAGGASTNPPATEDRKGLIQRLGSAIMNPKLGAYMLAAGQKMMQPTGPGQSQLTHIASALSGGLEGLAAMQALQQAREEYARKKDLEERQMRVSERAVGADEKRAATAESQGNRRLTIEEEQLAFSKEDAKERRKVSQEQLNLRLMEFDQSKQELAFRKKQHEDNLKLNTSKEANNMKVAADEQAYKKAYLGYLKSNLEVERMKAVNSKNDADGYRAATIAKQLTESQIEQEANAELMAQDPAKVGKRYKELFQTNYTKALGMVQGKPQPVAAPKTGGGEGAGRNPVKGEQRKYNGATYTFDGSVWRKG